MPIRVIDIPAREHGYGSLEFPSQPHFIDSENALADLNVAVQAAPHWNDLKVLTA